VKVEGGIEFDGLLGLIRLVDGRVQSLRMANARSLKVGSQELLCRVPAYRGKVARIEAEDPKNHRVYLDPPLPAEADLVGRTIHFENDVPWDTSFDIADRGSDWISTG